jgi:hypothetical protein
LSPNSLLNDKNEMKILYIFLNICLPYYSSIISTSTGTRGSISTFSSIVLFSFPINLIYGSISRWCILDTFSSSARLTSTFSYSWIIYGFWPPPLSSYGLFGFTSS